MFVISPITLGLAVTAPATLLKRDKALSVKLEVPEAKVASVADVAVIATVTNTGSEDVCILKYGTVLDNLPTRSFIITKDGAKVSFTGIKVLLALPS